MPLSLTRRALLEGSTAAMLAGALGAPAARSAERPKRILLRSSWQTVNIGDIGHTPGLLRLLETYLPDVDVTLWPNSLDRGVEPMLRRRFPRLRIARGGLNSEGRPATQEVRDAVAAADLFLHGSGPSVVGRKEMAAWTATGKPYGVYGVTVEALDDKLRGLLSGARFVFCRDTTSLAYLKQHGVTSPVMEFAPDATFAIDLRDEEKAKAYLQAHGLEERRFLCAIPRLRYTPYHRIHGRPETDETRRRDAVNAQFQEADHAKMREAIVAWVRRTGLKVLVCPEMTYELEILKPLLVDPLPDDVKPLVVRREEYWMPDEAGSVYARAHTLVSFEMHSPIIAAAQGTPAFYLREPTDTCKGQMWRDIGLTDWIFEIDTATGEGIARTLLGVHADYPSAQKKLAQAMAFVQRRQKETMAVVSASLGA